MTSIGDFAFDTSSLTSATIPASVSSIGQGPFYECTSLTEISVAAQNSFYSSSNGVLFDKSQATLIECPAGFSGSYAIPAGVTSIADYAFDDCSSLTSFTMPGSVTNIGQYAFFSCAGLANETIPGSVTGIGDYAFDGCSSLAGVFFTGNPPALGTNVFMYDSIATVYYLAGTTGWGATFGNRPTALWVPPNPLIVNNGPSFGVQTNRFGFLISGATNLSVVVEACTNLAHPAWLPPQTNTLSNGSSYFSDPEWTNFPARFYRLSSP